MPSPPVPNFKSKLRLAFVCKHAEISEHINELRANQSIRTILKVKIILLMDLDIELELYRKMYYIPPASNIYLYPTTTHYLIYKITGDYNSLAIYLNPIYYAEDIYSRIQYCFLLFLRRSEGNRG